MACTTYISDREYLEPTADKELNETLAAVRRVTGEDWRVREIVSTSRRWFRKPVTRRYYELLKKIVAGEFQVVNFYRPDKDPDPDRPFSSMNFINDAGYVTAYLYGILGGVQSAERHAKAESTQRKES